MCERCKDDGLPDTPATHKATTAPFWLLCREHALLALIAGWKPALIEEEQVKG